VLHFDWIGQGVVNLDVYAIVLELPDDIDEPGVSDVWAVFIEGGTEDCKLFQPPSYTKHNFTVARHICNAL
jgi:hypothetical protein